MRVAGVLWRTLEAQQLNKYLHVHCKGATKDTPLQFVYMYRLSIYPKPGPLCPCVQTLWLHVIPVSRCSILTLCTRSKGWMWHSARWESISLIPILYVLYNDMSESSPYMKQVMQTRDLRPCTHWDCIWRILTCYLILVVMSTFVPYMNRWWKVRAVGPCTLCSGPSCAGLDHRSWSSSKRCAKNQKNIEMPLDSFFAPTTER